MAMISDITFSISQIWQIRFSRKTRLSAIVIHKIIYFIYLGHNHHSYVVCLLDVPYLMFFEKVHIHNFWPSYINMSFIKSLRYVIQVTIQLVVDNVTGPPEALLFDRDQRSH